MMAALVRHLCSAALFLAGATGLNLFAQNIDGTIIIKRTLSKRRVTTSVSSYERGPAVPLSSDPAEDALAYDRSQVVVYLEGRLPQSVSEHLPIARMEQKNRRFWPETLAVEAGSKVSFPNLDPIFHNVFSLSGPKTFDLGNYSTGNTRVVTFPKPGVVYVNCHLHSNMTATIVVTPNQWKTLADRDGHFELTGVPPGTYTLVAWHKAAGSFRRKVEILKGRDEHVDFMIPLLEGRRDGEASDIVVSK